MTQTTKDSGFADAKTTPNCIGLDNAFDFSQATEVLRLQSCTASASWIEISSTFSIFVWPEQVRGAILGQT